MTKVRAPLSIDAALARIAGQVEGGWTTMAADVGRAERSVRRWGDKDAREKINFDAMLQLDLLFQRHGGEGFPVYEAYGQLLEVAVADRFVDQFEILRRASALVKETGEAEAAILRYALPGANEMDRREAQRELIEAIAAARQMLPLLEIAPSAPEPHSRGPPPGT